MKHKNRNSTGFSLIITLVVIVHFGCSDNKSRVKINSSGDNKNKIAHLGKIEPKPAVIKKRTTKPTSLKTKHLAEIEKLFPPTVKEAKKIYPWKRVNEKYEPLSRRYHVPQGFKRIKLIKNSWSWWIRHLPMKKKGAVPKDYKGQIIKDYEYYISGVFDLDVGKTDLQQCIDTLIRLRGEFLWAFGKKNRIRFRIGSRKLYSWYQWSNGIRPKWKKGRVKFVQTSHKGSSSRYFHAYLKYLYMMTGTVHYISKSPLSPARIQPGDYFVTIHPHPIMGGAGHAVMVLDIATNSLGETIILTGQGDIPAQDFHVIKNRNKGVWFKLPDKKSTKEFLWPTPFTWKKLRRFN